MESSILRASSLAAAALTAAGCEGSMWSDSWATVREGSIARQAAAFAARAQSDCSLVPLPLLLLLLQARAQCAHLVMAPAAVAAAVARTRLPQTE